jgi:hypothetical protein
MSSSSFLNAREIEILNPLRKKLQFLGHRVHIAPKQDVMERIAPLDHLVIMARKRGEFIRDDTRDQKTDVRKDLEIFPTWSTTGPTLSLKSFGIEIASVFDILIGFFEIAIELMRKSKSKVLTTRLMSL